MPHHKSIQKKIVEGVMKRKLLSGLFAVLIGVLTILGAEWADKFFSRCHQISQNVEHIADLEAAISNLTARADEARTQRWQTNGIIRDEFIHMQGEIDGLRYFRPIPASRPAPGQPPNEDLISEPKGSDEP